LLQFPVKRDAFFSWIGFRLASSSFGQSGCPRQSVALQSLTRVRLKAKMRFDVIHYLSPAGQDPFQRWLDGLTDLRCRAAVLRRVDRMADGNPGDQRFCRDGVWELRVDCGPGYRVYFARPTANRVLLLYGGSKRSQSIDITTAVAYWGAYMERR
jgi:putative addiction module killer protein